MAQLRAAAIAASLVLSLVAGCGDDDDGGGGNRPNKPSVPANTPQQQGNKGTLAEKVHIEDRVACPVPDRPSDPKTGKCDPKVPSCGEHLYCLTLAQGSFCEPCAERDGIRHSFKERDFALEQNRDPFQSFLLPQFGIRASNDLVQIDPTKKCLREDQMVASSYSYADLKLVGIVAQGTQRKVLMMGGPLGYIIKRGDCVGKEKAVVKDIGTGYITFQIDPDPTVIAQRTPEEYSVQLNPKQLMVNEPELPSTAPKTTIAPVVAPPATLPRYQGQPGQPGLQVQPGMAPNQQPLQPGAPAQPGGAQPVAPGAQGAVQVPTVPPTAAAPVQIQIQTPPRQ